MKLKNPFKEVILKRLTGILSVLAVALAPSVANADETDPNDIAIFVIETIDGEKTEIPLGDQPITLKKMSENEGVTFIEVTNGVSTYEIELPDILKFSFIPSPSSGVESVIISDSGEWEIYGTDGVLWQKGEGKPDLSSLPKGKVFIVKQGSVSYKIMSK